MKNKGYTKLIILILTVWCLILSILLYDSNLKIKENKTINEINVDGFSTDFTKVVDDNKDSIVTVNASGTLSTGFVYKQVDEKVYIVTSYHGVSTGYITVNFGNVYNAHATLVGKDIYADIAVLMITTPYSINKIQMSDSTLLKEGEFIINIGCNDSDEFCESIKLGMISSGHRIIENVINVDNKKYHYYLDTVQITSDLANGYSGSPVLNMDGKAIGMITMKYSSDVTLALTSNEIMIIADKIINEEAINKYNIGIKGTYISEMENFVKSNLNIDLDIVNGIYVDKVMDSSIGYIAGIKPGDIVLSINGTKLNSFDDYLNVSYTKASVLSFKVLRNNEELIFTVDLYA